jgi:hypothetical protein
MDAQSPRSDPRARRQAELARLDAIPQETWAIGERNAATAPPLTELSPESRARLAALLAGVAAMTDVCRTPDDAFAAGLRDGAAHPPLDVSQAVRVAVLLAATRAIADGHADSSR